MPIRASTTTRARQPQRVAGDEGFTLIELIIVIVVMGTIMSTLAAALVISLKATPTTEDRLDDARATRSLATWLSYDTTSAPPFLPEQPQGGMDLSSTANDCGGLGTNLLHLQWVESSFSSRTYVANYRFVVDGNSGEIVRYYCARTGTGAFVNVSLRSLTKGLDPLDPPVVSAVSTVETVTTTPGPPPVSTVKTTTTNTTASGATSVTIETIVPGTVDARPIAATVTFVLNGKSGEQVLVETSSRNPSSFFPSP